MGRYLHEAKRHAKEIEYFYEHAGEGGYSQALYHGGKLSSLAQRSSQSKSGKKDTPLILAIIKELQNKMNEMKEPKNS